MKAPSLLRISRPALATTLTLVLLLGVAATPSAGCAGEEAPVEDEGRRARAVLVEFDQNLVFPTTVLSFRLLGTDRMVASAAEVVFRGVSGTGQPIEGSYAVLAPEDGFERTRGDQGDILVDLPVDEGLWAQVQPMPNAVFQGEIQVRLVDELGVLAEGTAGTRTLNFSSDATPRVEPIVGGSRFVGERIEVLGENFLHPDEGTTWAIVQGRAEPTGGAEGFDLVEQRVAMVWSGERGRAGFPIDPAVFGVQPMNFQGSLRFENELRNGQTFPGNAQQSFSFDIAQSYLATLDPAQGSRGQRIRLIGRGFVPSDPGSQTGMLLRFEGVLRLDSGDEIELRGASALEEVPDAVPSEQEAIKAVWYEIVDGRLFGLGAAPGLFEGTITPVLYSPRGEQVGLAYEGTFRILPDRQVVFLKYLPAFSKGLEKYGLSNVDFEVRQRIHEVVERDYEGINVHFQDTPVVDFIDYATIEIGGPDPTGGNKFGYDNTCNVQAEKCKDTDNLYLADYLGGKNAASASEFNTPFGGVFIESFDYFSPTLHPDNPDASPSFDEVLGPFMPALGGTPVRGTEYPGGARDEAIERAIKMVGSVVGNTISHEIGHSLGLTFFPQDRIRPGASFHNTFPCPNCLMDPGSERPFEERAELDGLGPARFTEQNREYLLEILPETP